LEYRSYTRKTDVWSFGVVVWEFSKLESLTGVRASRKDVLPFGEIPDNEVLKLFPTKKLFFENGVWQ
jgi:serine/threonine protein kinase